MATVWINPAFKDKFPEKKEEKPVPKEKADPKKMEKKKEEKEKPEKKKSEKKKEKSGKKDKKPGKRKWSPPSKVEMKFLQYLEDNNIPVEIKFIGNKAKLTGKIIWSSDHMTCFKPDKKKSNSLIFNRVRLIYYKALEEVPLSANDLLAMSRIKMEKEMINRMAKNFPVEKLEPLIGKIFTEETLEEEIKKLDFTEEEVNKIMTQIKAMIYQDFIQKREFQRFKDEKVSLTFHIMDNQKIKGNLDWYEHLVYHVRSLDGKEEYNIPKNSVIYIEVEEVAA